MSWFKTFVSGVDTTFSTELNNNFLSICPVGSIIPWAKTITGTPALPVAWKECDGTTISDANSPMNGQAVPNLNGSTEATKLFLRGASASGGTGGSPTVTILSTPTTNGAGSAGVPGTYAITPPYYEVVFIIRIK